jgi:hypothetical protein
LSFSGLSVQLCYSYFVSLSATLWLGFDLCYRFRFGYYLGNLWLGSLGSGSLGFTLLGLFRFTILFCLFALMLLIFETFLRTVKLFKGKHSYVRS